jgi:hypothetical protein
MRWYSAEFSDNVEGKRVNFMTWALRKDRQKLGKLVLLPLVSMLQPHILDLSVGRFLFNSSSTSDLL